MAEETSKSPWLELAAEAYNSSTSFVDANYRKKWEDNLRHFQSRHASGSKYLKDAYKYRSKIFRPKTRSATRNNEAAAMAAFFANQDVLDVQAMNPEDPGQRASAEIMKEVLQYRLTKTIPWFQICLGAFQDAMVTGVVCSYQHWEYEESEEPEVYDEYGYQMSGKAPLKDCPVIELLPVENVRIHPSSDWTNPIQSSPYVIRLIPMYAMDVKNRMQKDDPKTGGPKWKKLTDGEIRSAIKPQFDSTRLTREGQREDKYRDESGEALSPFDVVWVHENFMRKDGNEVVYFTLGTEYLLTEPKPIEEVYPHGERPLVMGCAVIETHKIYPSSLVDIGCNVQQEINEVANQRLDNVKLVLNKRWLVKRGSQVDLRSIVRNVPGSVTLVNEVAGDVLPVEFHDVTGSSYQEQDRLNADFDELIGTFSASTVVTNRKLNETVGGMAMLRGGANSLIEYLIRTFAETWVEPVLRQILKLEQAYESDQVVLALAFQRARLWQRFGVNQVTDELLKRELTCNVNVGMGATDPLMKLNQFNIGMEAFTKAAAANMQLGGPLNMDEVGKEIFGRLGYKDGSRFLNQQEGQQQGPDPEKARMMQAIQQMQGAIQQLQGQVQDKSQDRQVKLIETQMREEGQDRRTQAQLQADMAMKYLDLLNPAAGEQSNG